MIGAASVVIKYSLGGARESMDGMGVRDGAS